MGVKLLFFILFLLIAGSSFSQTSDLVLNINDIRVENQIDNGVSGYHVYIRKKPGIESVMLTEPSGAHALRATMRNSINGNERRQISGVTLTGSYSQYSIVSSTPQPDPQFESAFLLFLPSNVVYGNPTSQFGTVHLNIDVESQINIRTFPHKFADPSGGRFHNNYFMLGDIFYRLDPAPPFVSHEISRSFDRTAQIRSHLEVLLSENNFLDSLSNIQLEAFLINTFTEVDREYRNRNRNR